MNIREKILIVEDEKSIAHFISTVLNNNGYEALLARSGAEAQSMISSHCPDLIILDLGLPDMDGLDILRHLRSNPDTRKVPVIMLTAKSSEFDKVTGLDSGDDDYVTKPFGVMELISRVRAVLRRSEQSYDSGELVMDQLHLNPQKHIVTVKGKEVVLTFKEFELLKCLMENKGRVVSRDTLMERLWATDSFVDENTLTVNIARLRKKLEKAGLMDFITTKVGEGYIIQQS